MSENVVSDNFNDENIKNVCQLIEEELRRAEEDERLGIPPKPVFGMINAGPPPCEVTITEESQKICADILCGL